MSRLGVIHDDEEVLGVSEEVYTVSEEASRHP